VADFTPPELAHQRVIETDSMTLSIGSIFGDQANLAGTLLDHNNRRKRRIVQINGVLLGYVVLNAALYSMLLPLWEGFDETFHFAYVQQLATGRGLPDARTATLSREVAISLQQAPASPSVKVNMPELVSYSEFFAWPPDRRLQTQRSLRDIPLEYRRQSSESFNYEGHQAPLAYVLLVVPESLLAAVPLPARVLSLRILAALSGSLLLYAGTRALCREMGMPEPYSNAALFCLFSSQMTWATLARVANDWLAVPLAVWALVVMVRFARDPSTRNAAVASLVISAGLLTKAYFLALIPMFLLISALRGGWRRLTVCSVILIACAGPWYLRNYYLYGSVSGTQESRAGIGLAAVIGGAFDVRWMTVLKGSIAAALWTANNSFRTFSSHTLNLVILVSAAALLMWVFSRHALAEYITLAYSASFLLALAYVAVVAHIYTHGGSSTPAPWYSQVLVSPFLSLAYLGMARHGRFGRWLAAALTLLFGYVLAVTYFFKLIPLYGGYEDRTSLRNIYQLYRSHFSMVASNLDSVALGPSALIFGLAIAVVLLLAWLEIMLIRSLVSQRAAP
jgi:hypothetical protein